MYALAFKATSQARQHPLKPASLGQRVIHLLIRSAPGLVHAPQFVSNMAHATGNFPESLRFCQKLTKVDLAHNLLEGGVPGGDARWINTMAVILLNNNKLSGKGRPVPTPQTRGTNSSPTSCIQKTCGVAQTVFLA